MPATTITRCADPPVPSASGASSLHSAVTVSTKRRPMATTSSASWPAGVRANWAASAADSARIASAEACTDARRPSSAVAREVGGGVEEADPGVDGAVDTVAEPGPDVCTPRRPRHPRWGSRCRTTPRHAVDGPLDPRPGAGRRSETCSSRRSRAGDHGVSSGSPAGTSRTNLVRSVGANSSIGST